MITSFLRRAASFVSATCVVAHCLPPGQAMAAETVALTRLDMKNLHFAGWKKPLLETAAKGRKFRIAGVDVDSGVGTYATSTLWLELDGKAERFACRVGVDDVLGDQTTDIIFSIYADGRKLWDSGVRRKGDKAVAVDLPLAGLKSVLLKLDHAGEPKPANFGVWAGGRIAYVGIAPKTVPVPYEEQVLLTPKPTPAPRINGPKVYGCRPGHPFLFRVPTTGERPMRFSADGLPPTLRMDAEKGIISGTAPERGTHRVTIKATNRHGEAARGFRIESGDTLALTPHMGWNHWYAHYDRITEALVREAADALLKSGMADVGYDHVNIDDCWMNKVPGKTGDPKRMGPNRDETGRLVPNSYFPDMAALTAYLHERGLKAGIYTSPGPATCAGYAGSYGHEEQDARQFAEWGFDFLKYDWCSYSRIAPGDKSLPTLQKPYRLMAECLRKMPRDIVFNLCQYGWGNVWEWGAAVGGHSWRTAGDLGGELNRIFDVALKNCEYRAYSRPGSWNDPDYIQIGWIGDAHTIGTPSPCPLTPTEQYSFVSLWSLMAAPLIFSGDMNRLDEFTLNVLCNPEVIEVNQDSLGECARAVVLDADRFLLVKTLDDGTRAIGLCNRGETAAEIAFTWNELGMEGAQTLRDLWRQRDLGEFADGYKTTVPRHGVVLLKAKPATMR